MMKRTWYYVMSCETGNSLSYHRSREDAVEQQSKVFQDTYIKEVALTF